MFVEIVTTPLVMFILYLVIIVAVALIRLHKHGRSVVWTSQYKVWVIVICTGLNFYSMMYLG